MSWLAGVIRLTSESQERVRELRGRGLFEDEQENVLSLSRMKRAVSPGDDPVEVSALFRVLVDQVLKLWAVGPAALYAQVLKTRRNDRVVKVERRAVHGAAWRFDEALRNSEDSSTLNTVHRAPEFDHPAKLGIPFETNASPRSFGGEARGAPGAAPLLMPISALTTLCRLPDNAA